MGTKAPQHRACRPRGCGAARGHRPPSQLDQRLRELGPWTHHIGDEGLRAGKVASEFRPHSGTALSRVPTGCPGTTGPETGPAQHLGSDPVWLADS